VLGQPARDFFGNLAAPDGVLGQCVEARDGSSVHGHYEDGCQLLAHVLARLRLDVIFQPRLFARKSRPVMCRPERLKGKLWSSLIRFQLGSRLFLVTSNRSLRVLGRRWRTDQRLEKRLAILFAQPNRFRFLNDLQRRLLQFIHYEVRYRGPA
jgi:hypothetical protein